MKATKHTIMTLAVGAAFGLAASAPGYAAKQGPRASVDVATVCDVDDLSLQDYNSFAPPGSLTGVVRVRDKSSGEGQPLVLNTSTVMGLAKTGQVTEAIGTTVLVTNNTLVPKGDKVTLPWYVDLCVQVGDGVYEINPLVREAKALNAQTTLNYNNNGAEPSRTVINMCSDDPSTAVIEPAGIKLTPDLITYIDAQCKSRP